MKLKHFVLSYILLLIIFSSCTFSLFNTNRKIDFLAEKAASIVQPFIDEGSMAGLVIGIRQGDEQQILKPFGYANLELKVPMPQNAVFEVGAINMQFLASAILKLEKEGKLKLNDKLSKYISFDNEDMEVSIQQLLNHTSGINDSLLNLTNNIAFEFVPGSQQAFSYSSDLLLRLVIEHISNQPYEEYINEQFLIPLELDQTYFTNRSDVVNQKVSGYELNDDVLEKNFPLPNILANYTTTLNMSAKDLLKWTYAVHHAEVLDNRQYEKLITRAQLNDHTPLRYANSFATGSHYQYNTFEHEGMKAGFACFSKYIPEKDFTIVLMANSSNGPDLPVLAKELIDFYLNIIPPPLPSYHGNVNLLTGTYVEQSYGGTSTPRRIEVSASSEKNQITLHYLDEGKKKIFRFLEGETWMHDNTKITFRKSADKVLGLDYDAMYVYQLFSKTTSSVAISD